MKLHSSGPQIIQKVFCIIVLVGFFFIFKHILGPTSDAQFHIEKTSAKPTASQALGMQLHMQHSTQQPSANEGEQQQKWFVHTSQCTIPYVNPFTPALLAIYKPPKFVPCSNDSDLVTPLYDVSQRRYVLHINEDVASRLLNSSAEEYNCYYKEITHSTQSDDDYNSLPSKYFSQGYVVPLHVEGMLVTCHTLSNASHVLQQDAFFLVQHKSTEQQSKLAAEKQSPNAPRKPSVIMFGIDSLSRINFRRTMPKVFEYLSQRGWYELQGYNKIDDNTFPNLMAVLTGYTPESAKQICDTSDLGCLDRFPLIWKFFKNAGYLTAYAEDEGYMSTFNYLKPGFQNPPVDYYFRPFLTAIESKLDIFKYKGCGLRYCIGRRLTSSYIYDFCQHYMQRFIDEHPIFGLFWTNSFSHDDYAMPALMADKILQYLQDFEAEGVFNSTIMIFFSDHGHRFDSSLLDLPEGFLEERLPTMFIWLPPWFRAQYPEYANALQLNRNRLCSNYDLHMTLKHIVELGSTDKLELPQAAECPKCQTLFKPMPENRTCADAAIIDHWCTCHPYEVVTPLDYARRIVPLILDHMNVYLAEKNLSSLCSNLTLNYINIVERKLAFNDRGVALIGDSSVYRAKFEVEQNKASFQATVDYNNRSKALDVNVETISRLNKYHDDSICIDDKVAKKYCICYSSIKKHE